MKITLTAAQLGEIEQHARRALPAEACGLIAGRIDNAGDALVTALHPSENLAEGCGSFEIDPALHMRLQRDLRGGDEEIIGVYHSHPSGLAEPSAHDARAAAYAGWVWLITAPRAAGGSGEEATVTRAYLHVSEETSRPALFEPVELRIQEKNQFVSAD
ncbi:MAG: M67 family metallopeptidase [Proteobacteria bacterium]|nr:M67 family metallopeptidase [Pseudomonadota bacterium]